MAASILLISILGVVIVSISSQAQENIGCFSFNHANTVLSMHVQQSIQSIVACIQQCQTHSFTYAGIRHGHNCYCGDNPDHTVNGPQLSDIRCSTSCNDHMRRCGDVDSIVIYSVCSRGRYHNSANEAPNCDASCNCINNSRCTYNGSCPGECEHGWSEVGCNVRVDPTTHSTTLQSEDGHRATSEGVTEHMTTNSSLPVISCDGCSDLLVALCVTSVGLVISIIVIIYLVYRQRAAKIPGKQSSAQIRATHNSSDRYSNDTQYENMGGIQTEPANYEQLGARQRDPATYEELGIAGPTNG